MEQVREEERKRKEYAEQVCTNSPLTHHPQLVLFQLEKERADKRKGRTCQFFGLGSSNKTSSPSTAAVANSNPPADDGQELDDLISALRSADIFTEDIKRRKHRKGKSTKTSGDSSKHRLI